MKTAVPSKEQKCCCGWGTQLFIPLQPPLSPMMILAIRIEHALDVAVQCPHDADARMQNLWS
jgi:hypothetical protein